VITHPLWVQEVPGSIPGSGKGFMYHVLLCCVVTFLSITHYLSQKFAIPFTMLIYLVYLKMLDMYILGQNCLHLTLKPYLSSETYSCKYEKLPNIVVHACKILQKIVFVENICPANLALFVYVSTHCAETVKWLDYNRYS